MPICIAGMHRSGTSMVTRLLKICGLYLGEQQHLLMPKPDNSYDNTEGYWENMRFITINERILSLFGGAWDYPPKFPKDWADQKTLSSLKKTAVSLSNEMEKIRPWGWKDPRNSLTIDFWKRLFADLKVIVCIRNPQEVAESLSRRAGSSAIFSFNLWKIYNQTLVEALEPKQFLVTHYESYFQEPFAEIQRIAKFAGLSVADGVVREAAATIKNRLWRNRVITHYLPKNIEKLYKILCSKSDGSFRTDKAHSDNFSNSGGSAQNISKWENFQERLLFYSKLLQQDPTNIDAYKGIGFVCIKLGRVQDAVDIFKMIAARHPEDVESTEALSQLTKMKNNETGDKHAVSHL